MGFVGNYAPLGLSPQMYGMPVIPKKAGRSLSDPPFSMVWYLTRKTTRSASLLESQSLFLPFGGSLYDVEHVVTQLLVVANEIHIAHGLGVVVLLRTNVVHVLSFQQGAQVVELLL